MEGEALLNRRRVKIVCTVGPASDSPKLLEQMMRRGMDVARLNMSHGTQEWHARTLKALGRLRKRLGRPLAILIDLQGPRVRVGSIPGSGLHLESGQRVWLIVNGGKGRGRAGVAQDLPEIPIDYPALHQDLRPKARILMDDGKLECVVEEVDSRGLRCIVQTGGWLKSHKGVNFPGSQLSTPSLTPKDGRDLLMALRHGVDYVALSFVRSAEDILRVKRRIRRLGKDVPVIAKIERPEAVDQIEAILGVADGVMVARGDLAIEMSPEDLPVLQKRIIALANRRARPVITATQMLESMTTNPRPTRAEATDVANAVFDGTDALMLSAETSAGNYPLEALTVMDRIAKRAENAGVSRLPFDLPPTGRRPAIPDAVCASAATAGAAVQAKAVVVLTESGSTARLMAHLHPSSPIVAIASSERVRQAMALYWGVLPYVIPPGGNTDQRIHEAERLLKEKKLAKAGDHVVIVTGMQAGSPGGTNLLKIHTIG